MSHPSEVQHTTRHRFVTLAACASIIVAFFTLVSPRHAIAQSACALLAPDYGMVTKTVVLNDSGSYDVWARVKAPDGAPQMSVSIDGSGGTVCDRPMSGSGASNQWVWIKSSFQLVWSGGSARVQLGGTKAGVGLDCVVITKNTSFAPTSAADCVPDVTEPNIGIEGNTNVKTNGESYTLTAAASDDSGVALVEFLVNGSVKQTVSTPPYSYTMDFGPGGFANGNYTVTAIAYDNSGNKTTSGVVTMKVRRPDIDRSNKVDIRDLLRVINGWSRDGRQATQPGLDLDDDGVVGIRDLLIVVNNWTR